MGGLEVLERGELMFLKLGILTPLQPMVCSDAINIITLITTRKHYKPSRSWRGPHNASLEDSFLQYCVYKLS